MNYLYIMGINPLSVTSFAHIFSHSKGCLFVLWFPLLYKSFSVWLGPIYLFLFLFLLPWEKNLRKHWWDLYQRMFCPWSLLGVLWCHVLVKSLNHFEFIYVHDVRVCSNVIDLHVTVQLSQHHFLKTLSFSPHIFLPPLSEINWP